MCRLAAGVCNRNHTMMKFVGAAMLKALEKTRTNQATFQR
jgi:hypothetical protein